MRKLKKWLHRSYLLRNIGAWFVFTRSVFTKAFRKETEECLDRLGASGAERETLGRDIRKTALRGKFAPEEYMKFGFSKKSAAERAAYVPHYELLRRFSRSRRNTLPPDKFLRYRLFRGRFLREMLHITFDGSEKERESYEAFLSRHETFIAKPCVGTEGRGVQKLSRAEAPDLASLKRLVRGASLLEEVIEQGEPMKSFHPSSVNTVRLGTVMNARGEFHVLYALIRMGQGGSVADNVGAGGLVAMVDKKTGVVVTDALCGLEFYPVHPDTKTAFRMTQLPDWDKLCLIAEEEHKKHPEQALFGWDFARTASGAWDVLEVNPAPSLISIQTLSGRGMRPLLKEYGVL